uniref:AAA+ ATPase domain-containing protein n=1 Tax=Parascaris univalens TaxID=6257 RepID=A0A915A7C9_PARUN
MVHIHANNDDNDDSLVTDINLLDSNEQSSNELSEPEARRRRQPRNKKITSAGRKARRRSSFFVPVRATVAKERGSCTESEKSEGEVSKSFVRRCSLRRSTIVLRKRPVQKPSSRTKFEFSFSPAPGHLRPILSAAQRAARRLSAKAVRHLRTRHVRINMEPQVIEITPRSDKIPGIIKMPSSPDPSDGDHRPIGIDECHPSFSSTNVNDSNPSHHAKGDGSGKYDEVTDTLETSTDVAMNMSDACPLNTKRTRQRHKKAKNNNNNISRFAACVRNHRLSVLPPPVSPLVLDDSDEKETESVSQNLQSAVPWEERKTASETTNNGKEENATDAEQDRESCSWTEECLLSLPTASSEHKVKVWMAIDNDRSSLQEANAAELISDEDNSCGFNEVTYPERNILSGNCDQKRSALTHRPSQSIKDEGEQMTEIAEDLTDKSMRERRRSFIIASERICSHDYMKSSSFRMPLTGAVDIPIISSRAYRSELSNASVDSSENIPLAPIFRTETTKCTKKTLKKASRARGDALKTPREPKSKKGDTKKPLKKRRQADRVTSITLNDEVIPIDEQSRSEPQANATKAELIASAESNGMEVEIISSTEANGVEVEIISSTETNGRGAEMIASSEANGMQAEMITSVGTTYRAASKWPIEERLDYAPFSSIGHVGAISITKQHLNTQPTKRQHRHRMRGCLAREVGSESSKFRTHDGFRKSIKQSHSPHSESAASAYKERIVEEAVNPSTHSCEEHNKRRIERVLPRLCHEPWCEVLKPHCVSDFIGNDLAVELVRSWIAKWKKHLERHAGKSPLSFPNTVKNPCKKKSSILDNDDSDEDYNDDFGEVSESILLLSGPSGCGKTALVYAVAEEMNMRVVELACNERRNSSIIRSRIGGATQSYQIACSPLMRSFNANDPAPQLSVILVDDVDVTFTDEENFWSTLKCICCETRAPIILTCSDVDAVKRELPIEMYEVKMNRPTAHQISNYLYTILTAIGMNGVSRLFLYRLAEYLNCDLRACINHLQFYSDSYETLYSSIPQERKLDDGEECLKKCRYLSSLSWCAPRFTSSDVRFRTHYADVTTSDNIEESKCLLAEEFPSVFERDDVRQHESILKTRSSLFRSRYCSTSDIACDYVPGLVLIDRSWRRSVAHTSRRRLHYFDSLSSHIGAKELVTALRSYKIAAY